MLKNYLKNNKDDASILLRKKHNGQNKSSNLHDFKSEEEDEIERIFFEKIPTKKIYGKYMRVVLFSDILTKQFLQHY